MLGALAPQSGGSRDKIEVKRERERERQGQGQSLPYLYVDLIWREMRVYLSPGKERSGLRKYPRNGDIGGCIVVADTHTSFLITRVSMKSIYCRHIAVIGT